MASSPVSTQPPAPPPPPPGKPLVAPPASSAKASVASSLAADKKRLAIVAAFVVVVVAVLVFAPSFFRSVKEESFVATARVAAQQGVLHADPKAGAKSVASVSRGTLVHVLALPKSFTSGYSRVQARDGDSFTRSGYIQSIELIEWESKDPKVALALARLSGPMEMGTDAEIRAQIDRLNSVAATFAGKPEAAAASLDAAKLEFALIKKNRDANPSSTDWQTSLADLASRLEPLQRDAAIQSAAGDLLKQIHDLMGTAANPQPPTPSGESNPPIVQPPPTQQTLPATPDDIKFWLQSAERLRQDSRYTEAKFMAQKVLKADPANADARKLLDKINAAIKLENSLK
jgi:hypothetical protein